MNINRYRSLQIDACPIVAATAITGTTVFYGIFQFRQTSKPSEVAETAPTVRQVTALGRLEPAAEVIKVSVPATLSNDRVAKLLVQRGDRVEAGQVIAIMDSRDRHKMPYSKRKHRLRYRRQSWQR